MKFYALIGFKNDDGCQGELADTRNTEEGAKALMRQIIRGETPHYPYVLIEVIEIDMDRDGKQVGWIRR